MSVCPIQVIDQEVSIAQVLQGLVQVVPVLHGFEDFSCALAEGDALIGAVGAHEHVAHVVDFLGFHDPVIAGHAAVGGHGFFVAGLRVDEVRFAKRQVAGEVG